jgi:predicted adenylyl cyclase CyaB
METRRRDEDRGLCMRNIELKARVADLDGARAVARGLSGGNPRETMRQVDTYFAAPRGRLKLREIARDGGASSCELIAYERADAAGPKSCTYDIAPVAHPAELKRTLARALGIRSVVDKRRELYLHKNVRIHLDRVERLGTFVEFEAVMSDATSAADGEPLVRELMRQFEIGEGVLVRESYADLVERIGP